MAIHIGTSGWSYDHWDHVLYPPGAPPRDRLAHYTRSFGTVELNASVLPLAARGVVPVLAPAAARRVPLLGQGAARPDARQAALRPEAWVGRIAAGWHELGPPRAVLLVQLAPDQARDDARLGYFLDLVPPWIRVAVELRHPSWNDEAVFAMLERHGAASCVMSGAGLPCVLRATAPFVYVRLHGPDHDHLYAGSYSDADLGWWADRIREWDRGGRDVFAYFNNDGHGHAVRNAATLRGMLGA
jgi:uncharacterized protein YecE (DUF72 family)